MSVEALPDLGQMSMLVDKEGKNGHSFTSSMEVPQRKVYELEDMEKQISASFSHAFVFSLKEEPIPII